MTHSFRDDGQLSSRLFRPVGLQFGANGRSYRRYLLRAHSALRFQRFPGRRLHNSLSTCFLSSPRSGKIIARLQVFLLKKKHVINFHPQAGLPVLTIPFVTTSAIFLAVTSGAGMLEGLIKAPDGHPPEYQRKRHVKQSLDPNAMGTP